MKSITFLFIFLLSLSSFAQDNLDQLKAKKESLNNQIKILSDSLKRIELKIKEEEDQTLVAKYKQSSFEPQETKIGGYLGMIYKEDCRVGNSIQTTKGHQVKIIGIGFNDQKFYKVEYEGNVGYIPGEDLVITPEIQKMHDALVTVVNAEKKKIATEKSEEQKRAYEIEQKRIEDQYKEIQANKVERDKQDQAKYEADLAKRKADLIKQYGNEIALKILAHKVWIGMNSDIAYESLGAPDDINRTRTSNRVSEQWIYPGHKYLYFENGILTTIQD